jgi:ATP-dependent DNA helicase PIF1
MSQIRKINIGVKMNPYKIAKQEPLPPNAESIEIPPTPVPQQDGGISTPVLPQVSPQTGGISTPVLPQVSPQDGGKIVRGIVLPATPLSVEQQQAFEQFASGKNVFITGPGGTGKTKLIHHLVDHANQTGRRVQVCALTGCASLLLGCNAKTIHSWSGIKLAKGTTEEIVGQVMRNRRAKQNWKAVKVLIVDEVSMMSRKIFDALETVARIVRGNPVPFGGIQVVFCGDFYQLPPIPSPNDPASGEFCFESTKWNTVFPLANHVELLTIFRQTDPVYIEILSQVRTGNISPENVEILKKYVKREYDAEKHNGTFLTKLFPIRSRVDYLNKLMFDKIDEPAKQYEVNRMCDCLTYIDTGKAIEMDIRHACSTMTKTEQEAELEQLIANTPCIPGLELKRGATVMCTVNLDMDNGICNGSQGTVIDFVGTDNRPQVRFSNGIIMTIGPHSWQSTDYPTIAISQFPLQLAWALTIHKIQGATLGMAQIDAGSGIFEYGQTYVALSRIQSLEGLYLAGFNSSKIKSNPKVRAFYESINNRSV